MTLEEKAKAYDEALAKVGKCTTDKYGTIIGMKPTDIFPELAESEGEKIRKELLDFIRYIRYNQEGIPKHFIERSSNYIFWIEKQGEQKPVWNEEDEQILNAAILHIKNETYNYYGGYSSEDIMQWLKSLKDRVQSKPKQEWSEEDERCVKNILWRMDGNILGPQYEDRCKNWLKSLKERINKG